MGRGNVAKKSLRFHATAKIVLDYQLVAKCPVAASRHCTLIGSPGGDGASGGSLRSSRQAGACHPFTRSWATMPPEAPPPPGFSCYVFSFCVVRKSLLCNKLTFFRVAVMRTLKIDIYLMVNYLCSTPRCHFLILVDSDWSLSLK